jgi:hypothetical protein
MKPSVTTASDDPARARDAHNAFAVFSFLWAGATLFHIASLYRWGDSIDEFLLGAAAVAVLARPSSVRRLLVLATLQVYVVGLELPGVANHWLLAAFVNLTILHAWVTLVVRGRSFVVTPGRLLRTFAPLARIELLALYFFAVLHKLNSDYFDIDTGCGAVLYLYQADRFTFLPESAGFQTASTYLTIGLEAAIPILLCTRRGRNLGIFLGLLFHTFLAFNPLSGFYNFSAMLFAMFFLFTSEDLASRSLELLGTLRSRARRIEWGRARRFSWRAALVGGGSVALGLTLLTLWRRAAYDDFLLPWAVYGFGLITLFVILVGRRVGNAHRGQRLFELKYAQLLAVPVLVVVNGLNPYLGLKTETSFGMFSNLRTEGNQSNHLFIPSSFQIFDFQKDLVEVMSSSRPQFQGYADRRLVLPFYEFRAIASEDPATEVSYIRNGEAHHVMRVGDDPELSHRPWTRKLLSFRAVSKERRQKCRH